MNDPAIHQILRDFKIRTNGIIITNFPCQEPISSMAESNMTVGLYVLQALRTMYYMDRGMAGHLPWTPGALYDWMKLQIKGVDVRSDSGVNYCCETYPDGKYIVTPIDGVAVSYLVTNWNVIAGKIAVFGHEARHVVGFSHSSCCGIANGCDNVFDTNNLSPYGIQWWLFKAWLLGEINVGLACGTPAQVQDFTNGTLNFCNNGYRPRFCTNPPPLLSAPADPGGPCVVERDGLRHFSPIDCTQASQNQF